jgi:Ca2+-binding EF-hand superfamily protein
VFKCLDADSGGTVDKPEIMAALKVLGVKASKEEIEAMISHVDTKNSGVYFLLVISLDCDSFQASWISNNSLN